MEAMVTPALRIEIDSVEFFQIRGWGHINGTPLMAPTILVDGVVHTAKTGFFHYPGLSIPNAVEAGQYGFVIYLPPTITWKGPNTQLILDFGDEQHKITVSIDKVNSWVARAGTLDPSNRDDLPAVLLGLAHCMFHPGAISYNEHTHRAMLACAGTFDIAVDGSALDQDTAETEAKIRNAQEHADPQSLFSEAYLAKGGPLTWDEVVQLAQGNLLEPRIFQGSFLATSDPLSLLEGQADAFELSHADGNWACLHDGYILTLQGKFAAAAERVWACKPDGGWLSVEYIERICAIITATLSGDARASKTGDGQLSRLIWAVAKLLETAVEARHRVDDEALISAFLSMLTALKIAHRQLFNHLHHILLRTYALSPAFWRHVDRKGMADAFPARHQRFVEDVNVFLKSRDTPTLKLGPDLLLEAMEHVQLDAYRSKDILFLVFQHILAAPKKTPARTKAVKALGTLSQAVSEETITRLLFSPRLSEEVKRAILTEAANDVEATLARLVYKDAYDLIVRMQQFRASFEALQAGLHAGVDDQIGTLHRIFVGQMTQCFENPAIRNYAVSYTCELVSSELSLGTEAAQARTLDVLNCLERDLPSGCLEGGVRRTFSQTLSRVADDAHDDTLPLTQKLASVARRVSHTVLGEGVNRGNISSTGGRPKLLVALYSCEKYLDTRVEQIRASWGKAFAEKGVAFRVFTGDCAKRFEEHIPMQGVSDTYENLPEKTLALCKWFSASEFDYLYKVDDDCHVDVDTVLSNAFYRNADYFGRLIEKSNSNFPRDWHIAKSQSSHARTMFDMSSCPSLYCDGGGGYILSKYAAEELLKARQTEQGAVLTSVSFMEDKMVGDLLALRGIKPTDLGYKTHQFRRQATSGPPVSQFGNFYVPNGLGDISLVHTDGREIDIYAAGKMPLFKPERIARARAPFALGSNTGQLELIKTADGSDDLGPAVFACMRNERHIIAHFLDFYRTRGIKTFYIADNLSNDGTLEYLYSQPDVTLYSVDTEYRLSQYGVAWQQAMLETHGIGRWCIAVDADEFIELPPGHSDFPSFLARGNGDTANAFRVLMIDMYPEGRLRDADVSSRQGFEDIRYTDKQPVNLFPLSRGHFSHDAVYKSAVRHRVTGPVDPNLYTAQKFCIFQYSPFFELTEGLHDVGNIQIADEVLRMRHVKYHDQFMKKVTEEVRRKQHFNGASEYATYKERIHMHGDLFRYEDSVRIDTPSDLYDLDI